jgi:hypothetical protein
VIAEDDSRDIFFVWMLVVVVVVGGGIYLNIYVLWLAQV